MADEVAANTRAIADRIQAVAGISIKKLPTGHGLCWFSPGFNPDGSPKPPAVFKREEQSPIHPAHLVFDVFQDTDTQARVYCLPKEKPAQGEAVALRVKLSLLAPVYFVERMNFDVFIAEVARELRRLDDATAELQVEDIDGKKVVTLLDPDVDNDEPDEPDEPETPETETAAAAPATA